jgi:hypothetical protein
MTKLNNRFAIPEELDLSSICKDVINEDDALQLGLGLIISIIMPMCGLTFKAI